jgi:hypothetical protein
MFIFRVYRKTEIAPDPGSCNRVRTVASRVRFFNSRIAGRTSRLRHRSLWVTILMSLSLGQRRVLEETEKTLLAEDPPLGSLFEVFNRLTRHDEMPGTEQVTVGPWQRLRHPAVVIPIAVIILLSMLMLSTLVRVGQVCDVTPAKAVRGQQAGRPARCLPGPAIRPATKNIPLNDQTQPVSATGFPMPARGA